MVIKGISWVLFVVTVWGSGFICLRPFKVRGLERMALGFVVGATLLPFGIFLVNAFTRARLLGDGRAGFLFTALLVVGLFILLLQEFVFANNNSRSHKPATEDRRLVRVFDLVLVFAAVVFFYLVVAGAAQPIYGWDEFSYWLYAAKLLYLSGGMSTVMRHDLYSSYPLGFPYLVAWAYHFLNGSTVAAAKWISPMVTLATLVVMDRALVRSGVQRANALLGVALVAWGSYNFLFYNWVAYGEMVYVDTYSVSMLYAALWLRDKQRTDLLLAGLLLGLSAFLRVDGFYIAVFTVAILLIANLKNKHSLHLAEGIGALALVLVPALSWYAFRAIYHLDSGWTTRISAAVISARLQSAVLPSLLQSMWSTIADIKMYPIDLLLPLLIFTWPFSRKREVFFLTALILAQLVYLFVAYISVFTTFEAAHASSLPRYMLRNEPLIALAYIFLLNGKSRLGRAGKGKFRRKTQTGT